MASAFRDAENWVLKSFSKTCEVSAPNWALASVEQSTEQKKPGEVAA